MTRYPHNTKRAQKDAHSMAMQLARQIEGAISRFRAQRDAAQLAQSIQTAFSRANAIYRAANDGAASEQGQLRIEKARALLQRALDQRSDPAAALAWFEKAGRQLQVASVAARKERLPNVMQRFTALSRYLDRTARQDERNLPSALEKTRVMLLQLKRQIGRPHSRLEGALRVLDRALNAPNAERRRAEALTLAASLQRMGLVDVREPGTPALDSRKAPASQAEALALAVVVALGTAMGTRDYEERIRYLARAKDVLANVRLPRRYGDRFDSETDRARVRLAQAIRKAQQALRADDAEGTSTAAIRQAYEEARNFYGAVAKRSG